jgi:tetratricopeptide (TPR) repeat protein
LVKADPAGSSGAPLFEFRHELLFLRTMIDERLTALATSRPEEGSTFFWNEALAAPAIPAEIEEPAIEFYEEGDLGTAEGAFRLLTACYPHYASGHCYLGKIAYDLGRVDEAMKMLELARMTAKGNLKKRGQVVPTSPIWDDDALGLVQATEELARIHCARQEYQVALELADELQFKTLDPATAGQIRAEVYLNQGNWSEAADSAITYSSTKDSCSVLAALAIYEMLPPFTSWG